MKLTVILRDDGPMIHCGDTPAYRSVQVDLTPEQVAAIAPRKTGSNGRQDEYESISKAFVEPNASDQAQLQPSPEDDCSACFWNEGGRCYVEPCDRLPDGRSKKLAETRCSHYATKRAVMSRVIPGEMLVITSEGKI